MTIIDNIERDLIGFQKWNKRSYGKYRMEWIYNDRVPIGACLKANSINAPTLLRVYFDGYAFLSDDIYSYFRRSNVRFLKEMLLRYFTIIPTEYGSITVYKRISIDKGIITHELSNESFGEFLQGYASKV